MMIIESKCMAVHICWERWYLVDEIGQLQYSSQIQIQIQIVVLSQPRRFQWAQMRLGQAEGIGPTEPTGPYGALKGPNGPKGPYRYRDLLTGPYPDKALVGPVGLLGP